MSGRGKGVRRRTGKAIAGRERTGERAMRAAVNPAPAVEPMARRRRRAAAETAPVRDPAPTPGQNQRRHSQCNLQSVYAQTRAPEMVR
ncbi:hypothetical protein DPMN_026398 [Dreissena polymorpha]|uniref:Uncharacterized protein n=1 Tax=Dreissena polymorpha TaxID=45954 RepID=A0A9D4LV40_DREPO|nr:hypothetical protein DPMN_026398 [Dreissena polymorpha]